MNDPANPVVYFGKTNFRNKERIFGIKKLDRRQHMYVIGQTGTGKSTLLKNLALQDIKAGYGVCIVDPHGEFVEEVLEMIPTERMQDVIYFNPVDHEHPIGFNVLEVPADDPQAKNLAASSLMGIFTKIWANVWSARMEYILNNAILALLDTPGTTLMGVMRLLVDKEYRKKILENVKDPIVRAFWMGEYEQYDPKFRNEAIAPIQNKVGQFLSNAMIRNIVGQAHSTINVYDVMNQEKILLVNVSKGRIGEDNSALLGAMIITKIQLAAMERIKILESKRKDFYLYVDEFQNFATDSFASILSEARKYRLNLLIAHQYIGQLVTDTSTKVRDAVFGNVGTRFSFRVGAIDAEVLEKEFSPEFVIQDLVNLPNHEIYLKMMVDNIRSRPFSAATLPTLKLEVVEHSVEKMIEFSRAHYARERSEVESEIAGWGEVDMKPQVVPLIKRNEPVGQRLSGALGNTYRQTPPREEQYPRPRVPQRPELPREAVRRMPPRMGQLVVKPEAQRPGRLSLSELAKTKPANAPVREHQRPRSLNRDALRKALGDAALVHKPEPQIITPAPAPKGPEPISDEKRGSPLKPGESIKL